MFNKSRENCKASAFEQKINNWKQNLNTDNYTVECSYMNILSVVREKKNIKKVKNIYQIL